ncbi:MAG TPA: aminoacyl-tRNA hydrolase [Bellilinea sp.]|nr:aminoacyl-tRNA hydrolase [Bellilinea sp.]
MLKFLFNKKPKANETDDLVNYLIAGLGNPGREYKTSRHNAGFMVIDALAAKLQSPLTRVQSNALVAVKTTRERRIILAKPQTFMNNSGSAVASLAKFYKVDLSNLMVINDDVDLPFGVLRMKPGGGSAGQRGLQSIIERLGSDNFPRLRVGVGRPSGQRASPGFVLNSFSKSETKDLEFVLSAAAEAALEFIDNGLEASMNKYNRSVLGD